MLGMVTTRLLGKFDAQNLANRAWTLATVDCLDALLFVALARVAEWHLAEFNAQNLTKTAWSFAMTDP